MPGPMDEITDGVQDAFSEFDLEAGLGPEGGPNAGDVADFAKEGWDAFAGKSLNRTEMASSVTALALGFSTYALRHMFHDVGIIFGTRRKNVRGRLRAFVHLSLIAGSAVGVGSLPFLIDPLGAGLQQIFSFVGNETIAFGVGVGACAMTSAGVTAWVTKKAADIFYKLVPQKDPVFHFTDQKITKLINAAGSPFLNREHFHETIAFLKAEHRRLSKFVFNFKRTKRELEIEHIIDEMRSYDSKGKTYNFGPLLEYMSKERNKLAYKLLFVKTNLAHPMIPAPWELKASIRTLQKALTPKKKGKSSEKEEVQPSSSRAEDLVKLQTLLQLQFDAFQLEKELAGFWHSPDHLEPSFYRNAIGEKQLPKKALDWSQRLFGWGQIQSQCDAKLKATRGHYYRVMQPKEDPVFRMV
ncbi:MAG TPA: hypothetical protein VJ205_01005 [Gammaproteobacteria bacterium]|nr:hypothetical protein [Gammaproteobacteria bacterium]